MYFATAAIVIFTILLISWYRKTRKYHHLPTSKYLIPFIGHSLRMTSDHTKMLQLQRYHFHETKSKYRVFWIFNWPIIASMDVKVNEEILKSMSFINKSYNVLNDWLGTGLLTSNGEKWKRRRRLLTPAFHFDILKSNLKILNYHAKKIILHLRRNASDKSIEFSSISKHFSLNVICETAMGVRCNIYDKSDESSEAAQYVEAVEIILNLLMRRIVKPWFHNSFMYRNFSSEGKKFYHYLEIAQNYVKNVIQTRIAKLADSKDEKSTIFLDILISAYKRNEIDIEGIIEEVNTFMFEGHDTVSSAISWTIYLLGRDERVQNKAFQEIANLEKDQLNFDDLQKLVYLEYIIKESLRLHPPVPLFIRQIENDCLLDSGLKIPGNTEFLFHAYQMQRDESVWKNGSTFYPERFEEEQFNLRNPFAFVPFSGGPRNCIGQRFAMMEMKITLFYLLKDFKFESIHQEDELVEEAEVIHRAGKGIWVRINDRVKTM